LRISHKTASLKREISYFGIEPWKELILYINTYSLHIKIFNIP
jgi:hypothetical protein